MQTQGTITGKPQKLIIVWWCEHNQDERVESYQISLPSWEAVISWATSQRDVPLYIRAE
jgi:hypothetical protein